MRGIRAVAAALVLMLMLSGCAMDVESYLQPPRAQGQQQALQDALEAAILQEADHYTFKYPTRGELSSAFVLLDSTGSLSSADDAVTAVAFYALGSGEYTHLHLLRRDGDSWLSVAVILGEGRDIDAVQVGDLDGDGDMELLVGWNVYGSDHQLSIYILEADGFTVMADAGSYHQYFVGDMTANGRDELALLRIVSTGTVTASLYAWKEDGLSLLDSAPLDGLITSFEKIIYGKLSSGADGLYIDARLSTGDYITDLIYWDGVQLCSPMYDPIRGGNAYSLRRAHVSAMDVNGNGVPDFPRTSPLATASEADREGSWQWLTEWLSWDVTVNSPVLQFASIVNRTDGYFIELENDWILTLSTRYDSEGHILWLEEMQEDGTAHPFLAVQNAADGRADVADEAYTLTELPGNAALRIWYDPDSAYRLTTEKISYMLVTFT